MQTRLIISELFATLALAAALTLPAYAKTPKPPQPLTAEERAEAAEQLLDIRESELRTAIQRWRATEIISRAVESERQAERAAAALEQWIRDRSGESGCKLNLEDRDKSGRRTFAWECPPSETPDAAGGGERGKR